DLAGAPPPSTTPPLGGPARCQLPNPPPPRGPKPPATWSKPRGSCYARCATNYGPNCLTHPWLLARHSRDGSQLLFTRFGCKNIDFVFWDFQWCKFGDAALGGGSRFEGSDDGHHR